MIKNTIKTDDRNSFNTKLFKIKIENEKYIVTQITENSLDELIKKFIYPLTKTS